MSFHFENNIYFFIEWPRTSNNEELWNKFFNICQSNTSINSESTNSTKVKIAFGVAYEMWNFILTSTELKVHHSVKRPKIWFIQAFQDVKQFYFNVTMQLQIEFLQTTTEPNRNKAVQEQINTTKLKITFSTVNLQFVLIRTEPNRVHSKRRGAVSCVYVCARERTCIVDMLQMLKWYIAITSCYHSTHRPIFRKTSKCQRRKYMVPNRRPSFTSSVLPTVWPFVFWCSIPRDDNNDEDEGGNQPKYRKKGNTQSDLPLNVSIDSGTITSTKHISSVCAVHSISGDFLCDMFFIIYLFVCFVGCMRINICQYSMFALLVHWGQNGKTPTTRNSLWQNRFNVS